jgi:hypothetical protein
LQAIFHQSASWPQGLRHFDLGTAKSWAYVDGVGVEVSIVMPDLEPAYAEPRLERVKFDAES